MNKTKIEWALNPDGTQGYTWNPITGCLNGCEYCYARKLANGRLRSRYQANTKIATVYAEGGEPYHKADKAISTIDPFYPRFWPERLDDLRTWTPDYMMPPRGIFVCDMGELFGDWVPREWQDTIFGIIKECSQHRFYLLTKQPQNLIKWSPFPENCWVGVSVTKKLDYIKATSYLFDIEAKVKYLSFEPLLSSMPLDMTALGYSDIDWVIIGSQTKPYKPPKIEWVNEIVLAAEKAGIPIFIKNNMLPLIKAHSIHKREDWTGVLRQEVPDA